MSSDSHICWTENGCRKLPVVSAEMFDMVEEFSFIFLLWESKNRRCHTRAVCVKYTVWGWNAWDVKTAVPRMATWGSSSQSTLVGILYLTLKIRLNYKLISYSKEVIIQWNLLLQKTYSFPESLRRPSWRKQADGEKFIKKHYIFFYKKKKKSFKKLVQIHSITLFIYIYITIYLKCLSVFLSIGTRMAKFCCEMMMSLSWLCYR